MVLRKCVVDSAHASDCICADYCLWQENANERQRVWYRIALGITRCLCGRRLSMDTTRRQRSA